MRSAPGFARLVPRRFLRAQLRGAVLARFALLAALVAASGCVSPAPDAAPPAPRLARVELINLSDCDWRIAFAPQAGHGERVLQLGVHEKLEAEFAGGDYAITQTALSGAIGPGASRQFSVLLQPSEAYRWRLATLIATPVGAGP